MCSWSFDELEYFDGLQRVIDLNIRQDKERRFFRDLEKWELEFSIIHVL